MNAIPGLPCLDVGVEPSNRSLAIPSQCSPILCRSVAISVYQLYLDIHCTFSITVSISIIVFVKIPAAGHSTVK